MPRIVIGGFPWEVPVFAGDTGEDDKGRVLILRIGRGDVIRVFLLWGFARAESGDAIVIHLGVAIAWIA